MFHFVSNSQFSLRNINMAKGIPPKDPPSTKVEINTRKTSQNGNHNADATERNLAAASSLSLTDQNPFDYGNSGCSRLTEANRYNTFSGVPRKSSIKLRPKNPVSRSASARTTTSVATKASLAFESSMPGCSLLHMYTLRILFWDILVSGGDVVTDFYRVSSPFLTS